MSNIGIMNVGKHCQYCRQLDFLPFVCEDCGNTLCAEHRRPEHHNCSSLKKATKQDSAKEATRPAKTGEVDKLFAAAKEPKSYERKSQVSSLKDVLSSEKGESFGGSAALEKVRKFVLQHKFNKKKARGLNFFNSNASQRIIMLSKLKSTAKGDIKVPNSERVYAWVIVVPENLEDYAKFFEDKNHLKDDFQKAFYMSRSWPVGRALDSFTNVYKIKNVNNKDIDKKNKLQLFRLVRSEEKDNAGTVVGINANGRVNKEVKDGDVLYLIRGYEAK